MADEAPQTRQVQRPSAKPESAGAKVTVFCKIPTGITIRVFAWTDQREQRFGGGYNEYRIAEPVGMPVTINGNRSGRLGEPATHRVIDDYGVTEGVSKDVWDAWVAQDPNRPMLVNRLIFAAEKRDYGEDAAHEMRDFFSGLGPMLKDGDPRGPRDLPNLQAVKAFQG